MNKEIKPTYECPNCKAENTEEEYCPHCGWEEE